MTLSINFFFLSLLLFYKIKQLLKYASHAYANNKDAAKPCFMLFLGKWITTPDRLQSKTLILWSETILSLETEFTIAVCRPTGDKWQLQSLFLVIFDLRLSTAKSVFDCRLSGLITMV